MWLAASGILVLFLYVNPTLSKVANNDATIKDAILSLARVIRDNSQRVDRSQVRERLANENLKKSIEDLSKKVSMIDTFMTRFTKIESQLSKFEQLISQRDERERIQMQKTIGSIQNLENSMEERLGRITNTITEINRRVEPDMISKLDNTEAHLLEKIARIESRLNSTAIKNEGEAAIQAEKLQTLFTKLDVKERTQNQGTENLIENLENRLRTQLENIKDTVTEINQRVEPTEPTPTTESVSASEIISKLDETEAHFLEKVARIESRLNRTAIKNDGEAAMQAEKLQTLFTKIDEKERSQNRKTESLIETLEGRLQTQLENIKGTVTEISQHVKPESVSASDIVSKLDDTEAHFLEKVARIESRLNTTAIKNEGQAATQAEKLQTLFTKIDEKERSLNQRTENLIESMENRLRTQLENIKDTVTEMSERVEPTEPTPTTESISASDIISKIDNTEAHFMEKVARIESSLNTTAVKNEEEAATQSEKLQTLFTKIDDKARTQNQNTEDLIEDLEKRLRTQLENIKDTVTEISQRVEPTEPAPTTESVSASDIISKLDATEAHCIENIARIESRLNSAAIKNEGEAATRAEKLQTVFTEVQNITSKLGSIESYVERAQRAANEAEEKPKKPIVDIGAICEEQTKALGKVTELVEETLNHIQVLPSTFEVQLLHNETQAALQETKHSLQSTVDDRINHVINSVDEHNNETRGTIERLRIDLATNAGDVNQKLRDLVSGQGVMVSTSDEVLSLRRQVEYGIGAINTNVGDLIKSHDAGNKNLNNKIDKISNDIIDNHSKELKNLTLKTDEGLKQIWRHSEVLYQTIDKNGDALDKLYKQSEICVNATIPTITSVKDEVAAMQSNVNYLLQQRSLMTQEFNTLKSNLGTALSDVKSAVKEIREKTEDLKHSGRQQNPPDSNGESNKSDQSGSFGYVEAH